MKWLEVCSYWNLLSVSWSALFMLAGDAEQPSLSSPIFHLLFSMFLPFLCHLMQLKDTGKPNCPLLDTFLSRRVGEEWLHKRRKQQERKRISRIVFADLSQMLVGARNRLLPSRNPDNRIIHQCGLQHRAELDTGDGLNVNLIS